MILLIGTRGFHGVKLRYFVCFVVTDTDIATGLSSQKVGSILKKIIIYFLSYHYILLLPTYLLLNVLTTHQKCSRSFASNDYNATNPHFIKIQAWLFKRQPGCLKEWRIRKKIVNRIMKTQANMLNVLFSVFWLLGNKWREAGRMAVSDYESNQKKLVYRYRKHFERKPFVREKQCITTSYPGSTL